MNEVRPAPRSITLRDIPEDVYWAIKRAVLDYHLAYPGTSFTQTDLLARLVREWMRRGGQLAENATEPLKMGKTPAPASTRV